TRMAPEIFAVSLHHLMWNDGAILHAEQPQDRMKGPHEPQHEGTVVHRAESPAAGHHAGRRTPSARVDPAVKDPSAAAGRTGIQQAVKTIHDVRRLHSPALSTGKGGVILEEHIGPQMKGPDPPVRRNLPTSRKRGDKTELVVRFHQRAIQLVYHPHDGPVFRKSRVQRCHTVGLIIIKDLLSRTGLPPAATGTK